MPLNYIKLKSNSKRQVKVQSSSIILEKSVQIRTRKKSVYGHFSLSVYSWEKVQGLESLIWLPSFFVALFFYYSIGLLINVVTSYFSSINQKPNKKKTI